jgi:hypothetical protein
MTQFQFKETVMFPWLYPFAPQIFQWAPQVHFPWSGAVTQDIAPETYFGAIAPGAGDAEIERDVLRHASFGKQLGILADVVSGLVEPPRSDEDKAADTHARAQLKRVRADVATVKAGHQERRIQEALKTLSTLRQREPQRYARLIAELADS